jgi:hypothetical protein
MKIARPVVLLADKSLYDVWIRADIDVSFLEKVEKTIGKILVSNDVAEKVVNSIKRMPDLSPKQFIVWKTQVRRDNDAYLEILADSSNDLSEVSKQVKEETDMILGVLQKLDAGASKDDVEIIAISKWVRQNTLFEPLIVTEDRDLLTCGHIITSFFGLVLGFLSCFELMRLAGLNEPLARYCEYYEIESECKPIESKWLKATLEAEISSSLKKAKIACHPSPRGIRPLQVIRR